VTGVQTCALPFYGLVAWPLSEAETRNATAWHPGHPGGGGRG
jgi:hypothetical protein